MSLILTCAMLDATHPYWDQFQATEDGEVFKRGRDRPVARQHNSANVVGIEVRQEINGKMERTTVRLKDFVYECFNGSVPDGHSVVLKTTDQDDCSLANLEVISTAERERRETSQRDQRRVELEIDGWRCHPIYRNYMARKDGVMFSLLVDEIIQPKATQTAFIHEGRKRMVSVGRIIFECFYGLLDADLGVFHIDGKLDNTAVVNLKAMTKTEIRQAIADRHPDMGQKIAETLGKPVVRIRADSQTGDSVGQAQFSSMRAAIDSVAGATHTSLLKAIREREEYLGYFWEQVSFEDLPNERWVTIDDPKFNGFEFSNLGRIKMPYGKTFGNKHVDGFTIGLNGHTYQVHFLICWAFHGPPPTGAGWEKLSVDHINHDHGHNSEVNLRWSNPDLQMRNIRKAPRVQSFYLDNGEVIDTFDHKSDAMRICRAKYTGKGFDSRSISRCCEGEQKYSGKIDGRKVGWRKAEVEQ